MGSRVKDDYKIKNPNSSSAIYIFETNEISKKWVNFCNKQFSSPQNQTKNKHAKVHKYTMVAMANVSGTVFRINRDGNDKFQAVPLDTNVVSKLNSNFLIKHSKNLTLVSKTADQDLSKIIDTKFKKELKNTEIESALFFTQNYFEQIEECQIKVFLNHTNVFIKNFPVSKFKQFLNKHDTNKESIQIFTESKATNELSTNKDLIYAKKRNIDESIKITVRDNAISNIEYHNDSVDFSLPFKSTAIIKFYENLKCKNT